MKDTPSTEEGSRPEVPRRSWFSFFRMELFFDFLLIVVTAVYASFAYKQWRAIDRQANLIDKQLNIMQGQAASMNEQLVSIREQTTTLKDSLSETRKAVRAAVVQANASKLSAQTAQRGLALSAQSLRLEQRPIIGIQSVTRRGEVAAGERPAAILVLVNTGRAPALNTTFIGEMFLVHLIEPPAGVVSLPRTSAIVLAPQAVFPMEVQIGNKLPKQVLEYLADANLLVWGSISYTDLGGHSYVTEFCFYSKAPEYSAFVACPSHNSFR